MSLLTQIANALNEGGLINVPSVFRAMEKETIERVAAECLAEYDATVKQIVDRESADADRLFRFRI